MWRASFLPDSDCLRSHHGPIVPWVSASVLHTEVFLPSLNVLPSPPTQLDQVSSTISCDCPKYNQAIIGLSLGWVSTGLKATELKHRFQAGYTSSSAPYFCVWHINLFIQHLFSREPSLVGLWGYFEL